MAYENVPRPKTTPRHKFRSNYAVLDGPAFCVEDQWDWVDLSEYAVAFTAEPGYGQMQLLSYFIDPDRVLVDYRLPENVVTENDLLDDKLQLHVVIFASEIAGPGEFYIEKYVPLATDTFVDWTGYETYASSAFTGGGTPDVWTGYGAGLTLPAGAKSTQIILKSELTVVS